VSETADLHAAQAELAAYGQWVIWYYEGKQKKPVDPYCGGFASTADPETWSDYATATRALVESNSYEGVGFVFAEGDPFTGIDLDDCLDDGEVQPWALRIVEALDSYTEVSPSGTGLKIWIRASKPGEKCRTGSIEMYDKDRFFTFTGRQFGDRTTIEDRQEELGGLYFSLFPAPENDGINTVVSGGGFTGEDEELLEKARNCGTGKLFTSLYDHGDTSKHFYDDSRADLALCGMLAFWTGRDADRMDRLFRASRLMRPKWDERRGNTTYGEQTITKAIKGCKNVYEPDNYKAAVQDYIRGILAGCMELAVSGKWAGRSGPTDRDVYKALIYTVLDYGRKVDAGVKVSASLRDLALGSGIGRRATISGALRRLEARGLIRRVYNGGTRKASEYVLLTQNRTINNRVNRYGTHLSQTVLIRNPGRTYGTIGKKSAQIIDYVHALGRIVTENELAKHFGIRKNNLKARNLNTLLELGLLEEKEAGYVIPTDIDERLERELKDSGCEKAHDLQRQQYERERDAWRQKDSGEKTVLILDTKQETPNNAEEIVKNIPPKSQDGIIHHAARCACWLCENDAPEYVPMEKERVA
jgi:putative DNA primase/helicase